MNVEREDSSVAKGEYALLCKLPQNLDEKTKWTVMGSKSKRKEYRVREVMGKLIGQEQHFLNKTFIPLLEEGKVKSVYGLVFFLSYNSCKHFLREPQINKEILGLWIYSLIWPNVVQLMPQPPKIPILSHLDWKPYDDHKVQFTFPGCGLG